MTTNLQLFNKLNCFKSFLGVFSCDRLPIVSELPCSLIMNTDPHDKPGQHWVAIHINSKRNGLYFDSYGFPPLNHEFTEFLNQNCYNWTYNRYMIQGYNTVTCGQYCVLFILLKTLGYKLADIIHLFTHDFQVNDEIVVKIFENL